MSASTIIINFFTNKIDNYIFYYTFYKQDILKMAKVKALIDIENTYKSDIKTTYDTSKEKLFVTFPYPYMNGNLHLGHGFAVSLLDFYVRFQRNSKNVLFPFAFHGTGMPIVACANKVIEELANGQGPQLDILKSMGITEYGKFVDPYYWVTYFSKKAEQDLKQLGISADFDRSFVTTDMNPYYDKFIKWQFNKLLEKGIIVFGEQPIIFSPKDNQPCSDHDRAIGEQVGIKVWNLIIHNGFLVPIDKNKEIKNIVCDSMQTFYKIIFQDQELITSERICNNLKFQNHEFKIIEVCDISNQVQGKYFGVSYESNESSSVYNGIKYYEPEKLVTSRSGNECVVAIREQWFINYDNDKDAILDYINHFITNERARPIFRATCEWLQKWPMSRSFGLGTQLFDTEYKIDSLSDSTIYMALYTIYNTLKQIDIENVDDELFDAIFLDKPCTKDFVIKMNTEFKYWYPIDLRLSGKDLIGNHLTMSLFNHQFIWGKPCIDRIYTCGHVQIYNKDTKKVEKMSKSKGNFKTIEEIVSKYGADATRMVFAKIESDMDDAVFKENMLDEAVLSLYAELESCLSIIEYLKTEFIPNDNFIHKVFEAEIYHNANKCYDAFSNLSFQTALKTGFYDMISAKNSYIKSCKDFGIPMDHNILKLYLEYHIKTIQPICPHYTDHIFATYNFDRTWVYIKDKSCLPIWQNKNMESYLNTIRSSMKKRKSNNITINFEIGNSIIANNYKIVAESIKNSNSIDMTLEQKKFSQYIKTQIKIYGFDICDWHIDSLYDEKNIILNSIKNIIEFENKDIAFSIIVTENSAVQPWKAIIKVVLN